jgi:broad specificity phosphatase PhoE
MKRLILIRHSKPKLSRTTPSHDWKLSERGRKLCRPLAEKLREYDVDVVVTSSEPKAEETGELIADELGVLMRTIGGLQEQARYTSPWFESAEDRSDAMLPMFDHWDEVIYGEESAQAAYERFSRAIEGLKERYEDKVVAVVTHGTVMSLFLEKHAGLNAKDFWLNMGIPMYVSLIPRDEYYEVEAIVKDVAE